MNDTITFTHARYESLKKAYNKAVADNADSFVWEGYEMVTKYAQYLIEFLQPKFESSKRQQS